MGPWRPLIFTSQVSLQLDLLGLAAARAKPLCRELALPAQCPAAKGGDRGESARESFRTKHLVIGFGAQWFSPKSQVAVWTSWFRVRVRTRVWHPSTNPNTISRFLLFFSHSM